MPSNSSRASFMRTSVSTRSSTFSVICPPLWCAFRAFGMPLYEFAARGACYNTAIPLPYEARDVPTAGTFSGKHQILCGLCTFARIVDSKLFLVHRQLRVHSRKRELFNKVRKYCQLERRRGQAIGRSVKVSTLLPTPNYKLVHIGTIGSLIAM